MGSFTDRDLEYTVALDAALVVIVVIAVASLFVDHPPGWWTVAFAVAATFALGVRAGQLVEIRRHRNDLPPE